ncbi:MAG: hypothetical protein U9P42_01030 [Candidatus Fermentibacteria bacterium]|nr:hypothetical protein [Candidatus Fermentibacteria bacterium]
MSKNAYFAKVAITLAAFSSSMFISTKIIKKWIVPLKKPTEEEEGEGNKGNQNSEKSKKIGYWIGFFETIIVFSFVYVGAYGALAIIMGAKEYVRKEEIEKNASYYLLGTLINVSIAVLIAQIALLLITEAQLPPIICIKALQ